MTGQSEQNVRREELKGKAVARKLNMSPSDWNEFWVYLAVSQSVTQSSYTGQTTGTGLIDGRNRHAPVTLFFSTQFTRPKNKQLLRYYTKKCFINSWHFTFMKHYVILITHTRKHILRWKDKQTSRELWSACNGGNYEYKLGYCCQSSYGDNVT